MKISLDTKVFLIVFCVGLTVVSIMAHIKENYNQDYMYLVLGIMFYFLYKYIVMRIELKRLKRI